MVRILLVVLALAAPGYAQSPFALSSPAFPSGGTYPVEFTCDGESASPPLAWANPPAGTRSFAVTMHHIPGPGDKHVYMVIYNIPATVHSLGKNAHDIGDWGINTVNGRSEYTPPCSKGPGPKTYTLTVYALSEARLAIPASRVTMDALLAAIKDKTLATSAMDIVYSRQGNGGGPRTPPELERALSSLHLSGDQEQKVQSLLREYGEKQRQLREELLHQLRNTLDADQYVKVETSLRQPPPR
jgi:phosphatidylethanolamine-binding protein (PEBP) family uncharacterized protein